MNTVHPLFTYFGVNRCFLFTNLHIWFKKSKFYSCSTLYKIEYLWLMSSLPYRRASGYCFFGSSAFPSCSTSVLWYFEPLQHRIYDSYRSDAHSILSTRLMQELQDLVSSWQGYHEKLAVPVAHKFVDRMLNFRRSDEHLGQKHKLWKRKTTLNQIKYFYQQLKKPFMVE